MVSVDLGLISHPHVSLSEFHPVLVDKPVTPTVDQAKELGELAKSKNLILYAFQNRRWDSDFLALSKLLSLPPSSPQYLGHVWEFESRYIWVQLPKISVFCT
jgi:predicted dehydrogenase